MGISWNLKRPSAKSSKQDDAGDETGLALAALLVSPNQTLAGQFRRSAAECGAFRLVDERTSYPSLQVLDQLIGNLKPAVLLLDLESSLEAADEITRFVSAFRPETRVITLHRSEDAEAALRSIRLGAKGFLHVPFTARSLKAAAEKIAGELRRGPLFKDEDGKVIAFTSAKPGSGASTLAMQTAFALQRLGKRVLLVDFNMTGGTISTCLGLRHHSSILNALWHAGELDPIRWSSLTTHASGIDVLIAPDEPCLEAVDAAHLRNVLEYARLLYDWVLVDLPVVFQPGNKLIFGETHLTFLVTTTELPGLHFAKRAIAYLGAAGFERKYRIVVNRAYQQNDPDAKGLKEIFESAVYARCPDDSLSLNSAEVENKPLEKECPLRTAFDEIAERLTGRRPEPRTHVEPPPAESMTEELTVSAAA